MTFDEAQAEFTTLRGLAEGRDLSFFKDRIAKLYQVVCRKALRECNCKNVLQDAMIEIYAQLQHYKSHMEEFKAKARLVLGVVLQVEGKHYTNANLTDEVARKFLANFPQRKDWFAVLPPDEAEAEVAEQPTEVAPEKVEAESKPTIAPKKKKPSTKRK